MSSKDYYKILGINQTATQDEIKSVYRKLTKQYHPDVNKNPGAEEKFKEINEAYDTLSDPTKRANYDSLRKFGFNGGGNPFKNAGFNQQSSQQRPRANYNDGPYWDFRHEDIFKNIFNEYEKRGTSKKHFEADLNCELDVTFMEAALGATKPVCFDRKISCQTCKGIGFKGQVQSCGNCNGRRTVNVEKEVPGVGRFVTKELCSICHGTGLSYRDPCNSCYKKGYVTQQESIDVQIPAGTETGNKLRIKGYGNKNLHSVGDLFLHIRVNENHPTFKREGKTIYSKCTVGLKEILLGEEVTAETIHGPVKVKIPFGSQPNTKIKLAKQGVAGGDHILELNLVLPNKLSDYQKSIISQLDI